MIKLDTSAIFVLEDRKDPDHKRVRRVFEADGGPYLVPVGALAEMTFFLIEDRLGLPALDAFRSNLADRALSLDCGEDVSGSGSSLRVIATSRSAPPTRV